MTTQDDDQNNRAGAVQITQTLVLSAAPPERAAADLGKTHSMGSAVPETAPLDWDEPAHLAKTQLLPIDIANMRVRGASIVHGRPGSNDGKTQILWAGQKVQRHPLAKTQPLSKTQIIEAKRARAAFELAQMGRWIRNPSHIRATVAATAVVLACCATWIFTARTDVAAGTAVQLRVAAAPTTTTSASTSVGATSYAVAAPADPASGTGVVVAPNMRPSASQSMERAAVDALYTGDYRRAAQHYTALASADPNQRVYVEALRILQRAAKE